MSRVALWCFTHRVLVAMFWLLTVGGLLCGWLAAGSGYRDSLTLPHSDSQRARSVLEQQFPSDAGDQVLITWQSQHAHEPVTDANVQGQVVPMLAKVAQLPHVAAVESPYGGAGRSAGGRVSPNGQVGFATVVFDASGQALPGDAVNAVVDTARAASGSLVHVAVGGSDVNPPSHSALGMSEMIGLGVAAAVLLVAFGSLLAMLLPLFVAAAAVGGALATVTLLSHAFTFASVSPSLTALIGLGVGIDYALFVVTRYRAALKVGTSRPDAVAQAMSTSGRAVVFAGLTVCIALLGLFVTGVSFLYGLAIAAAIGVVFTVLVTITLLPALLSLVGKRVLSRRERRRLAADGPATEATGRGWLAWSRTVQAHPVWFTTAALAVVAVLAFPVLHLRLGSSDQGSDPRGSSTRMAYDMLSHGFGPGFNAPLVLVASDGTDHDGASTDLTAVTSNVRATVTALHGVAQVSPVTVSPGGQAAVMTVYPTTGPQDEATDQLLSTLRHDVLPAVTAHSGVRVYVGGETATSADFTSVLGKKLFVFIGTVIGLSFLLLLLAFRSILIPAIGAVMNLLAACAAYGVLVAVFQWGWGADLIGLPKSGPIEAFLPVMLFAVLFGLSMDYQVFLVSRMHEEWLRTGNNAHAVSRGQADTGRVITAAASIMIAVFGSFVAGGQPVIQMFGLGLATAIALDAVVIRTVLVPALMQTLGKACWWLPARLDAVLPRLHIERAPATSNT